MATFLQTVDTLQASYRQANYWATQGFIPIGDHSPGSGHTRHLTDREVALLQIMDRLVAAGFAPKPAGLLAELLADGHQVTVHGVTITINLHEKEAA